MVFKMTEKDLNKIQFFQLLHLKAIDPGKNSSKILGNHIFISSSKYNNLLEKNDKIITGYENFCITKGIIKLFPPKDFDFIGQHVVCQKCCQKFASRKSYKAHVGTEICVRSYNGPNLIYLKYKNRNCRQVRKKDKKSQTDLHNHDIKKNLLNPEMLNTLQTRNNCYSDVVYQRNKNKEKQVNSNNKNDEPHVKKPRGRPRKIIEVEPKRQRGRPRKSNTNDSLSQNNISLDNNLESYKIALKEPRIVNECSTDDAYNNNINEIEEIQMLSSKIKSLTNKFQKLVNNELDVDNNYSGFKNSAGHNHTQCNKGDKKYDISVKDKEIIFNIESLENDLINLLSKQSLGKNEYKDELEFMLSELKEKQDEYNQKKLKKIDINNGSTTDKGKENIQRTIKKADDENDVNKNKIDDDINEKRVEVWFNDERGTVSPTMTISTDDREKLISSDDYKNNLETLTEDMTPNCTNSVNNHAYNSLNYIFNPPLECKVCGKPFESIAEWKMHLSEHLAMVNGKFLCTTCGLKFNMYKNFIKHMNIHGKMEQKNKNCKSLKKYFRNLKCRKCNKQYNYLRSYFSHIKTHVQ